MKNILLVEDDEIVCEIIQRILKEGDNYDVDYVKSGEEAVELVKSGNYNAILMDISLGGEINGFQAAEMIMSFTDIPIIIVTGDDSEEAQEKISRINSYGYVSKPVNFKELKTTINIALLRYMSEKELKEKELKLQLSTQVLELLNIDQSYEDVISDILFIIKTKMDLGSVSIRLKSEGHYPYFFRIGFDEEFVAMQETTENDEDSTNLDMLCEIVLNKGEAENARFLTMGGSFWTNNIEEFIDKNKNEFSSFSFSSERKALDYNSIALIPLYSENEIIGILQLSDKKEGVFNENTIKFFERISSSIGIAISRKKTEDRLKKNERLLRKSQDIAQLVGVEYDIENDCLSMSGNAQQLFHQNRNYSAMNLEEFLSLVHSLDREAVAKKIREGVDINQCISIIFRTENNDEIAYIKFVSDEIKPSKDNKPIVIGAFQDITEHFKNIKTIKDNQRFLEEILAGIEAGIIVVDPTDGKIIDVNNKIVDFIGKEKKDIMGKSWENNFESMISMEKLLSNKDLRLLNSDAVLRIDGNAHMPVNLSVFNINWSGKKSKAVIIFDKSKQKDMERQIVHMQKLESIGQLAAGIAHEINTPTQYVGDNITFLKTSFASFLDYLSFVSESIEKNRDNSDIDKLSELIGGKYKELDLDFLTEEIPDAIDQSKEGVARIAQIVSAMKKFSHPGTDEKKYANINESIENTVTVARNEWKYVADVNLDLDSSIGGIPCYPGDLNQVFLNIVVNAAHAISDKFSNADQKGEINISTKTHNDMVYISIKDNGGGIPEEIKNRIFDPFFTTKEVGKGTGQGLSIAHDIIYEKHGGTIEVNSKIGEGTEFIIGLPMN